MIEIVLYYFLKANQKSSTMMSVPKVYIEKSYLDEKVKPKIFDHMVLSFMPGGTRGQGMKQKSLNRFRHHSNHSDWKNYT